ncbi:MAG TPA: hypothetical protein VFV61_10845 [Pyrinomonadaceae bacterium]|nr:hypothetical protein [Pyrinomonadaceae bacterium]
MSTTTKNPVVEAIISGKAPQPARLAAASGLLPLPQADLLEVLVALQQQDDPEIATAAGETLREQDNSDLLNAAKNTDTSAAVLSYLGSVTGAREIHEAVILNKNTPDQAIVQLASTIEDGSLLELITQNQQRLVRLPKIIDAVLQNPARTTEAERRARETQTEFFEKERGAKQIAGELRARGKNAAAEFFESAELTTIHGELSLEDAWLIAEHIEVSDAELDDSWLPSERYDEVEDEASLAAAMQKVIEYETLEAGAPIAPDRVSLIRRLMLMNARDRMKLARKGDREARSILIRDSNKMVAVAVINNPRITEQEAENIATMRTVADEVLRLMAMNRNWARSYTIIHNLVRNPRTPIPTVINILPRIRTKDLLGLKQNRNISDAIRRQANRLAQARSGE